MLSCPTRYAVKIKWYFRIPPTTNNPETRCDFINPTFWGVFVLNLCPQTVHHAWPKVKKRLRHIVMSIKLNRRWRQFSCVDWLTNWKQSILHHSAKSNLFSRFLRLAQYGDLKILLKKPIPVRSVIQHYYHSLKFDSHFVDKATSQAIIKRWFKKVEDTGSDAPNKVLQRRMRLEVVGELVEIVGSCPCFASKYLA